MMSMIERVAELNKRMADLNRLLENEKFIGIAELRAEVERLTKERDYWQSQHDERIHQLGQCEDETPSRTSKVKVTDAMVTRALSAFEKDHPHNRAAMRAGGQPIDQELRDAAKAMGAEVARNVPMVGAGRQAVVPTEKPTHAMRVTCDELNNSLGIDSFVNFDLVWEIIHPHLPVRPTPSGQAVEPSADHFDEYAATGKSCDYTANGLNGEQQCQYCGKPAVTEVQQKPVMWQWRTGKSSRHAPDVWDWTPWQTGRKPDHVEDRQYRKYEERPLYLHPSKQVVTDEMVERLELEYQVLFGKYLLSSHARRLIKAAMEAGR